MKISFAPMEGIGKCTYRSLHAQMFGGADDYYSPFIAPDSSGNCKKADLRDVLPENNIGCSLVPQILANNPLAFLNVAGELQAMGYRHVNLNAGCPSGTVVSKHKGAGMLKDPASLDAFLSQVFDSCTMSISVKTRIGMESPDEFPALLDIYNRYPLTALIIHVRTREGMYKSEPDHAAFDFAMANSSLPLCYNGNIFTQGEYESLISRHKGLNHVMAGRGVLSNPGLLRQLKGGAALEKAELMEFHDRYLELSLASGLSEHFALQRMKELWTYMGCMFPDGKKYTKPIYKAKYLSDYRSAVSQLFIRGEFEPNAGFKW